MKDSRTKPFLLSIFAYFTVGCMVLTANTVLDSIIHEFSWSDSQGGLLITCMSMGNLVMSIVGNLLMEKTGRRGAMVLYSGMMAVSFGLFALLPSPATFYPLMVLAGLAWGGINSLVNTVVTEMYHGNASKLNIMHACYAIGAVTFPLIVGFLTNSGISWRVPAGLVAGLGVLLLVLSALTKIPERVKHVDESGKTADVQFWKELGFYIGVITLFMYVGVESAASSWLSGYLKLVNPFFERVPAQTMVSLMWAMLLVGRLIFAAVSAKMDRRVLLAVLSAGFLAGVAGLVAFAANTVCAILFTVVTGLSMSAIYATAVANSARYVEGSAIAPGIMFGAGGLGSAIIPYIAGLVSDTAGLRAGMSSLCFFLIILLSASLLNLRPQKQ